jgi:hypothetical protein
LEFDASKSNPIYGKSDTVQPPAILMKYVIVYKQLEGGNVIINTEGGSGGVIDGEILVSVPIPQNNWSSLTQNTKDSLSSMQVSDDTIAGIDELADSAA